MVDSGERAILLVNLGSPETPAVRDVRRFLTELLSDPYVIDLPWGIRHALVRGAIVPMRVRQSARAYESIWNHAGGPLRHFMNAAANSLARRISLDVGVAMRYGEDCIGAKLNELKPTTEVLLTPLYPQYATSTYESVVKIARRAAQRLGLKVYVLKPFYANRDFVRVSAEHIRQHLDPDVEHLIMSFHGVPLRQLRKKDPTSSHCLASQTCCELTTTTNAAHATCYRHQCLQTFQRISAELSLPTSIAFQSRLGRLRWLEPYTDDRVVGLAKRGFRNVAVYAPSFTCDNVETLEELGVRARQQFLEHGGSSLQLIPCLNDNADWIDVLASWVQHPDQTYAPLN